MTNDKIIKLALDAHLLNYVDNETPKFYFINGHAEYEDVINFANLIVEEYKKIISEIQSDDYDVCCVNILQ
jgi:hypothetical protein